MKGLISFALALLFLSGCDSGTKIDEVFGGSASPSPTPATGIIGNSALSLSPTDYNFGLVSVSQTASPLTVVIQNVTGVPIYLTSLSGTSDPNFSLAQLNCPTGATAIAPGASCSAKINFSPLVGGTLQYQVTALFGVLAGDSSFTTNVTLSGIGVSQVTFAGLSAINPATVTTTSVDLSWAQASGASSYIIYQSTDGGTTYTLAQNLGASAVSWTLTGLTPGTSYVFKMKAFNALGQADSNTVTQSATTDTLGSFSALANLNTAEGGTVTSADLGLACTDAKGHYPSFMAITSASDSAAQCVLLTAPYRVQCTPGYKVGSSPYSSTLAISCLLDAYPTAYTQSLNVNVAFTDRAPIIALIGNQNVLAGTAINPVTPSASSPNSFTLTYACKYDTLVDGAVAVSAADCSTLLNQNASAATFSTSTGAFSWTPPLSASGIPYEFKITVTDPYSLKASSLFVINVGEPPPDPVHSLITVAQASLNSGSSTVVTLHAKDASGNPIPKGGSTVTFSASSGGGASTGNFSVTTDNNDGTYTATFTGVLSGASTQIQGNAQGVAITSALPAITVLPGPVSTATSVLSVSSSSVASGSSLTVNLTSKDAAGNLVTSGGKTVAFARTGGSSTGTFSASVDHTNGTYTSNFTGMLAGSATTLTATINGVSVSSALPSVTVTPGSLSLLQSTLTVASSATLVQSGASLNLTLTTRDSNGNTMNTSGQSVSFSNSGGSSTGSFSAQLDNGNGTYSSVFTGSTAGTATVLSASIGGMALTSTLPSVSVTPGVISNSQSLVSVGSSSLISGNTTLLTLTAKDASGNLLTSGGSTVSFTKSVSTIGNISTPIDNGNGTYQATFTANLVGTSSLSASINGGAVTSLAPSLSVSPGPISLSQSLVSSSSPSVTSGASVTLNLQAKDSAGNNLTTGGRTVLFTRTGGTSQGNFSSISDNANGTYGTTFTGTTAGTATVISATVDGSSLTSSGANVSVIPANLSLSNSTLTLSSATVNSGGSITLTMVARDASGNPLSGGGLTVSFSNAGGTSSGSFTPPVDHGDGAYTSVFTATTAGSATTMSASIGGSQITSPLPTLTVSPGSLSYSQSLVSVSSASVASGTSVNLTLYAKDANGNLLSGGGQVVSFALGGGTSGGNISTVTDNLNGTYSAVFTGTTSGTAANVTANIAGTPLTSVSPSITVTAGAISYSRSVISLSASAIQSGQTTNLSLLVRDLNGNTVILPGLSVFFAKSGGTSNGTFSAVTDNGNGSYSAVLVGTTSGTTSSIVATINGNSVTSASPNFTVSPGALSLSQSNVTLSSSSVSSGGTVTLTLTTRDLNGNLLSTGGGSVIFSRTGGTSNGTFSLVSDNANGTYTSLFTASTSGTPTTIQGSIGGSTLTSTAPTLTVNAGVISLSQSVIAVSSSSVTSGNTVNLTLTAKDANGNLLPGGGSVVLFTRNGGTSSGAISTAVDNSNGTYTSIFTSSTSGTATSIGVTVNGSAVTSAQPTITVNPSSISLSQSQVIVSSSIVNSGNSITLTLTAKDLNGNLIGAGGAVVIFSRSGGVSSGTMSATTDNTNGTYTAVFTGTTSGTATTINASIGGSLVSSVLPSVTVNPGTLSLLQSTVSIAGNASFIASGSSISLKLTTRDSNGNQLNNGGQVVVFNAVGGSSSGAFSGLSDNLDGTYSVLYTGASAGTANSMSATVGGIALTSVAPTLAVVPGSISYSNSTLAVSSPSIVAGTLSTLTLTARDTNGNILSAGGLKHCF